MTPQEIKDILDKSGYLFEQKVASVIGRLDYHTMTNRAFFDTEENKSREIDVVAHKSVFEIDNKFRVTGISYLNCECKNSTTPYVFITRKKGLLDKYYKPDGIFLANQEYFSRGDNNTKKAMDGFYYLGLDKQHYATNSDNHAVQICRIIQNGSKKEAQHSGVIEGFIYPLIKSIKIWEAQTPTNTDERKYCKFFFNLAVVSSKIYTIDSEVENSLPVEQRFVPFVREIQTKDLKGQFLITFVTFEHLKDFIEKEIQGFCESVYEAYRERPELLLAPSLFDIS